MFFFYGKKKIKSGKKKFSNKLTNFPKGGEMCEELTEYLAFPHPTPPPQPWGAVGCGTRRWKKKVVWGWVSPPPPPCISAGIATGSPARGRKAVFTAARVPQMHV